MDLWCEKRRETIPFQRPEATLPDQSLDVLTYDKLKLEVRMWAGGRRTPVLCIPGLTRNAADFDDFGPMIAATGRDVYAISLRGRGRSDRDPTYLNYVPGTYVRDVTGALDQLGLARAIFVGTSLGGIVTMLTAETAPARIAAAIVNDVGPELAPEGIMRIAGYVGARAANPGGVATSLDDAIAAIRAVNEVAFPGRDRNFWETFANRTFDQQADGSWTLAYDPLIGRAMLEAGPAPDLWPAFARLAPIKTLVVRGALSDLLTPPIIEKMRTVHPAFDYCEVANVGHAPTLTEPDAANAIDRFLTNID
jgi:pimeloyl-ACP methyl ester carboxylesterase